MKRLKKLAMFSLRGRRLRGDMIEVLSSWLRLSRVGKESKIYLAFTFILNPSFIDTTFQVKQLMIGLVLERGLFRVLYPVLVTNK